jgi:hypothetical protein
MFDTWQSRVTTFYRDAEAAAIIARAQCRTIVKAADVAAELARPFDFADLQGKPEPASWGPTYPEGASASVSKWRMTSKGRELSSDEKREYGQAVGEWIKGLNSVKAAQRVSLKYSMPNYAAKCRAEFAAAAGVDKRAWAAGKSKNDRGETIEQAYARAMAEKAKRLAGEIVAAPVRLNTQPTLKPSKRIARKAAKQREAA